MATLIAFPPCKRLDFVRKHARHMAFKATSERAAESHLAQTLKVQRETLLRRGLDEETVEREIKALETAIRSGVVKCRFEGDPGIDQRERERQQRSEERRKSRLAIMVAAEPEVEPVALRPESRQPWWQSVALALLEHPGAGTLNDRQEGFLQNMVDWPREPTEAQADWLRAIARKLRALDREKPQAGDQQ